MASPALRLAGNAAGEFFVDSTCIDCGACRWIAPAIFDAHRGQSRVRHQPRTQAEERRAELALVACPVGAIGSRSKRDLKAARAAFPDPVDGPVFHCGYHAEASFGAASYFIRRPAGNILVDSPRFARPLVERIEALGGIRHMFLTHRDDVADHAKWAAHFGCERILHEADAGRGTRAIEVKLAGDAPVRLDDEVTLIPVPGHTRGSTCLLFRDTYLFSGDHVAWSPRLRQIYAFRDACWYDWDRLRESMERLAAFKFAWILPGHGWPCHFPVGRMAAERRRCLAWMRAA